MRGPTPDEWERMSKTDKKIHWVFGIIVWAILISLFIIRFIL